MNPNTNHLVAFKTPEEIEVLQQQGYELIPNELQEAAREKNESYDLEAKELAVARAKLQAYTQIKVDLLGLLY